MAAKILVADDEPNIVELVRVCFEGVDAAVSFAKDGGEAWNLAREIRPDVIVLDAMMPKIDGFQLCRMIKNDPDLCGSSVVILSAKGSPRDIQNGMDAGASVYMCKPFSPREFVSRVMELVTKGRMDSRER